MSDFQIEPVGAGSHDLVLAEAQPRDFVLIGQDATTWPTLVAQRVLYVVSTWLGESLFDRQKGFPWEQGVFAREPLEGIVTYLYDFIIAVDGVEDVPEPPTILLDNAARIATIQVDLNGREFEAAVAQIVTEPT